MAASRSEQLNVMAERYLEIVFSDLGNTVLLLLQAPVIAFLTVLVWRDNVDGATDQLYWVLALSAVWFGTLNSCREIVKERGIFEREVRLGLGVAPYLLSKCLVLGLLSFVQCLALAFIVNLWIPLGGPVIFHFVFLWLASLGGTALGLALSCVMSNSDRAVGAVVLVLIPQILFSEMALSHAHATKLILWAEDLTFLSWTFAGLKEVTRSQWSAWTLFQSAGALLFLSVALLGLAYASLSWRTRKVLH